MVSIHCLSLSSVCICIPQTGRLLSKEGLLDFTARLPYMKVGPLRFPHATYFLMAAACVTLGHVGVLMYHCGGDEYEYYCPDDDLECLTQMR